MYPSTPHTFCAYTRLQKISIHKQILTESKVVIHFVDSVMVLVKCIDHIFTPGIQLLFYAQVILYELNEVSLSCLKQFIQVFNQLLAQCSDYRFTWALLITTKFTITIMANIIAFLTM